MNEVELTGTIQDLLKQININIRKVMEEEYHKHQITFHQLYILRVIKANKEINYKALAKELNLAKSSISLTITKLVNDGYVEAKECDNDRRIKYLGLTELGEQKLNETKNSIRLAFNNILSDIKHNDLLIIENSLKMLKEAIENSIGNERSINNA